MYSLYSCSSAHGGGRERVLPIFACPMLAVLSSEDCCGALVNENIVLFFLGGWLLLLLNNCGLDKRMACMFLAAGDKNTYTPLKLLLKSCMAAFCISAVAERDLTTQAIMTYVIDALEPLKAVKNEANYVELKIILCNAIAISSLLGSMCMVHASLTTLQLRSLYAEPTVKDTEFPDVFNFLNYSVYAYPTALVMFIFNTIYEVILVSQLAAKKPMSPVSREKLQKAFAKYKKDLGPWTPHEMVSMFFLFVILALFFTRWSPWLNMGWATFRQYGGESPDLCGVKDATTAAIFVVLLHFLPKSINFLKVWTVKKHRDLPEMKVESGILFWKFVDKHTDYSLFLVFGAGSIIYKAIWATGLADGIPNSGGDGVTGMHWYGGIFIVVLVSVFFGSIMTGMAAQACLMPLMLAMAMTGQDKWPGRRNLVALGVGLGTGLGFCLPFEHTPSALVSKTAKVELKKQVMYSIVSTIICMIVLWLSLCFYAPVLWDPEDKGIFHQVVPGGSTTEAGAAPAEP
ncbi:protein I'm not dead yet-like isoform X2 [Cydia pomonella]|uniref:protein I'm not dead yet-like isoform X2 n=1 Tax=Cydia pomonella TaxID=82600 RepID=UPI002ADE5C65|nr:protein I'm not dead yet-like isoform X2 [Cydia pomonella]